jgi:hypothetical protein
LAEEIYGDEVSLVFFGLLSDLRAIVGVIAGNPQ